MAGISAYDSNSISTLFSSISNNTKSAGSGATGFLSSISDYNLIRNGSYGKLMRAYYGNGTSNQAVKGIKNSTATSKDTAKTLTRMQDSADSLSESASALLETGSKSVFHKTSSTDENGKTTSDYDTDKIYKAVKSFVDDYNSAVIAADKTESDSIRNYAVKMINYSEKNASSLDELGISIDSDNYRLSIDEDKFKSADMSKAKSLFNGAGSYAYSVKTYASMMKYNAQQEASKANTYTNTGKYGYTYSAGSVWDSFY